MEVRILCDGMGGRFMPKKRWDQMRSAGIKVGVFFPPFLGWLNLRVNYRNHRGKSWWWTATQGLWVA